MSSIFWTRNKLMIPIVSFQSLWIFWWLVFTCTSNLIVQTTWLKVKLKLVNLYAHLDFRSQPCLPRQTFPGSVEERLMRLMSGWDTLSRISGACGWYQPHGWISRYQPHSAAGLLKYVLTLSILDTLAGLPFWMTNPYWPFPLNLSLSSRW